MDLLTLTWVALKEYDHKEPPKRERMNYPPAPTGAKSKPKRAHKTTNTKRARKRRYNHQRRPKQ